MEKRNALLLLSQSYEFFPVVEKHAGYILKLVDGIKDQQDGFNDVKTLAMSLAVKLRSRQEFWVDKVEQEPAKRWAAEASQGDKAAGRSKNGLGTSSSQTKPDDSKGAVTSERDRDRQSGTKRQAGEDAAQNDKRSRREDEGQDRRGKEEATSKDAKDGKDHKDSKEAKEGRESKDAKSRDRIDSKAPKDEKAREVKEVRDHGKEKTRIVSERPREKEPAEKQRTDKDGDRKRGSGSGSGLLQPAPAAVRSATASDDRGIEKRRRTDRDGDAPEAGDRGTSDRHGG